MDLGLFILHLLFISGFFAVGFLMGKYSARKNFVNVFVKILKRN